MQSFMSEFNKKLKKQKQQFTKAKETAKERQNQVHMYTFFQSLLCDTSGPLATLSLRH